jgi:hypothetical protein
VFITHNSIMEDPTSIDEVSIPLPAENTRNILRRKVGTKTFPWAASAIDHTPPPPPPPPQNGRRMSVRRKFADLLEYFNPFAANPVSPPPQDEDTPAKKKARLESSKSIAEDVGVGEAAHTIDTSTTSSPSDIVADVPRDIVTVSSPLQITETPRARRKWTAEEDAKLTDAVKKHGNNWVPIAAIIPSRTNVQCRMRWAGSLNPLIERKIGKWTSGEDARLTSAVKKFGNNWVAIAAIIPGRTSGQCCKRWAQTVDPSIDRKLGKWTSGEEARLTSAVKKCGNDWVAVAALVPGRTNAQCRRSWTLRLDPNINRKLGKWTAEEEARLTSAVKKCGNDWVAVAALVPGRNNKVCRSRWAENLEPNTNNAIQRRGKWTAEEDGKLFVAVTKYGKDWVAVAVLVPGRTNEQCRARWASCLDPGMNRATGKWTAEEDAKLIEGAQKHGKDWVAVATLVPGRSNKDCRSRWAENLEPNTNHAKQRRGKWTAEEDAKLFDAVTKYGKDWVAVAALVSGRSKKDCCSRWAKQRRGKWTAEEDAKLFDAVTKYGKDWVAVAALVSGRSKKDCCSRWADNVEPSTNR